MQLQYDLFTEKTLLSAEESHILRLEIKGLLDSSSKMRRALFARLGEQSKLILKLMQEIDELRSRKRPEVISLSETFEETFFERRNYDSFNL